MDPMQWLKDDLNKLELRIENGFHDLSKEITSLKITRAKFLGMASLAGGVATIIIESAFRYLHG